MLCTIMRPMLAAMEGRDFRSFMEAFLRYAGHSWGKVFNFAWSIGMTIGPIVALVLLWDDPGSTSFVLIAIGLGIVIVGVLIVSNVWKTPTYNMILAWDPAAMPADWEAGRGATSRSTGGDLVGVRPVPLGADLPLAGRAARSDVRVQRLCGERLGCRHRHRHRLRPHVDDGRHGRSLRHEANAPDAERDCAEAAEVESRRRGVGEQGPVSQRASTPE
jgi:hypothetical protein